MIQLIIAVIAIIVGIVLINKIKDNKTRDFITQVDEKNIILVKEVKPEITEELLSNVKDKIGSGSTYYSTSNSDRETNLIVGASKLNGMLVMPDEIVSFNTMVAPITAENGYKAANVIQGDEYVLDLEQSDSLNVEIETADNVRYKLKRFISRPSTILQNFNDASVLSHITVTEGGTAALSEEYATEGSAAHICVVGKITGNELVDAAYVPSFTVSTAALNGISNLSEVNIMNMDLYNSGEEACKVTIKIYSGTSYISAGEFTLNSGENALTLSVSDLKFSSLSSADRIVFEFANSTDGVTANEYNLYLDNMIAKD